MSVPTINITEINGALGALPSGIRPLAIVGAADSGSLDTPAAYARTKDIVTTYTGGPLVSWASHAIEKYGRPVLLVRTGNSIAATLGTIDITGALGTSVPSLGGDVTPNDDYELYWICTTGGTIGVDGIKFQYSYDNGRTLSGIQALGTATSFTFPNSGGASFSFAAGTVLAGSVVKVRANAPKWNTSELATALTALKNSSVDWEFALIVGDCDGAAFDQLETSFGSGIMLEKAYVASARMPNTGESESSYKTALDTIFSVKSTNRGMVCAGAAKVIDGANFRQGRHHVAMAVAPRIAFLSEEVDAAWIDAAGALGGVDIRDVNGNVDEHDENVNPGLDDSRFCVLRTIDGIQGVYINNPRILSAAGSDFEFFQHRRVMNLARRALRLYFTRRLSKQILVNASTGLILEAEALEIEAGAHAAVAAELNAKPKASGGGFAKQRYVKLSRTDNILSTKTLTVQARIVPLAYPKAINIDLGFYNPALVVAAV